jgi:hypothetical protein
MLAKNPNAPPIKKRKQVHLVNPESQRKRLKDMHDAFDNDGESQVESDKESDPFIDVN